MDESKQDESFKGELEETEMEQLAEDDPAKLLSRYIRHILHNKHKSLYRSPRLRKCSELGAM